MRILKFGGKSLGTLQKTQNICKYIKKIYKKDKEIIIVVSAIGKTTDNLIELAKSYGSSSDTRELDCLLSTGETQSSALMAIMLNSFGVPAKSFQAHQLQITTFGAHGNSKIAYINKDPIYKCFDDKSVAVVAGFQGINQNNETTTLGRGGSDITAAALGASFDCNVEIYSDFNGVFAGDPRILPFKKLKKINYQEMINMADGGSKVLERRATEIAKSFGIDIISKGSSNLSKTGSIVSNIENDLIAISTKESICQITVTFSNINKMNFIVKNVLKCINCINYYNLNIKSNLITFTIPMHEKNKILLNLSKRLNLLQTKKDAGN